MAGNYYAARVSRTLNMMTTAHTPANEAGVLHARWVAEPVIWWRTSKYREWRDWIAVPANAAAWTTAGGYPPYA